MIPTLTTPRLTLRPHRLDDFDAYAAMWAEPAVVRFIGGTPFTREAAWIRFLRHAGLWQHLGFGFLAIADRETGAFIGECGFHDLKRAIVPSIEGTMEAGWALVTTAQGKGLAEEAMRAALGWADEHGTGERITCLIEPDHAASIRVAEKLGFSRYTDGLYNGRSVVLLARPRGSAMTGIAVEEG
ncbi:GNAT family N-acetyltransferase [Ancylobacter lacus]|uniref:GNAT family N-acetyltransferase n=1 Tax=Ancylobacter lacus TaxID=2579970 RepID=UPI001BCE3A17|nr:GNAT family N-acetyltransferase [Ancylobacter lacus]MBS7540229.1 GNAT family N-acetyltransferase [Ancylobacter lacus]